jgi:glycosyltransferase involved in cell wall biosynthesis
MRIVLISTFDQKGGAGIAALRLMRGLRALGLDCSLRVKEKTSADPHVRLLRLPTGRTAQQQCRAAEQIQKYCINRNRSPISNTFFSLGFPGYDLSRDDEVLTADVIHLHWVSNLLSPAAVTCLQQLGKPVVWTLHDQRVFTGGCHYSAGCRRYEDGCEACPQLEDRTLRLTETILRESAGCLEDNLAIVCPSDWMAGCARASSLLKNRRIETIPNGVDTSVFKPHRSEARKRLGFESRRIYLLAGADVGAERRKGFQLLAPALRQVLERAPAEVGNRVELVVFGDQPANGYGGVPSRPLGRIDSETELADVYAACDAFLLPSLEDNFPNTMLESMCCGTPVIGFKTGGIPEAVNHGKSGLLAPSGDAHELAREILRFLGNAELRAGLSSGCEAVRSRFSLPMQARRHEALYQELMRPRTDGVPLFGREIHPVAPLGAPMAEALPGLLRYARRQQWRHRLRTLIPWWAERPLASS